MTHNQLKRVLWHTACPVEMDEPEQSICQSCRETFLPMNGEWFCPDCEENLSLVERSVITANVTYWLEHGNE